MLSFWGICAKITIHIGILASSLMPRYMQYWISILMNPSFKNLAQNYKPFRDNLDHKIPFVTKWEWFYLHSEQMVWMTRECSNKPTSKMAI